MSAEYDEAASSVHQIRAILQILARKQDIRSLAFVSPTRGSGKTSLSVGVAASLALSGTRCLVVDCDIAGRIARRGSVSRIHPDAQPVNEGHMQSTIDGIACASGYINSDSLGGEAEGSSAPLGAGIAGMLDGLPFSHCVVESTSTSGLGFLPAHTANQSHIGQMSEAFVGRVIREASKTYDMVLIDTGLVPGSVESLMAASRVDAVVIVLDDTVCMADYQRMLSYLKLADVVIAGTVFNKTGDQGPDTVTDTYDPDDFSQYGATGGSGILAASVLTDSAAGYSEMDWDRVDPNTVIGGIVND